MKLQSLSITITFILIVIGFTEMVRSLCLVRSTLTPKSYWYHCVMSDDYLSDVKKAPIDIQRLTFTNSKAKIIRNGSFDRLSKNLERLGFFYSDVEEIDDNAFRRLNKLDLLAFVGNKLKVIKSSWFEGLLNLKTVSFQSNEIKYIEDDFFSILPRLDVLDISINEITCISTASIGNFKSNEFHFRHNPLTSMCQALLMNWLKDTNIQYDYLDHANLDAPYDLTKICIEKLPGSNLDESLLNKCIENTTRQLLPNKDNYTVKEVCEFLKDTPSPFLNCTE